MKQIVLICPKCGQIFAYKNYFAWVLHSPMHWFGKRYTKCPHCGKRSWVMKQLTVEDLKWRG